MVSTLHSKYEARCHISQVSAVVEALIAHMHITHMTLADVEAIAPSLSHHLKIMEKVATNIGVIPRAR
jgi:cellobiose-specific phosphotransferase system component IIB